MSGTVAVHENMVVQTKVQLLLCAYTSKTVCSIQLSLMAVHAVCDTLPIALRMDN